MKRSLFTLSVFIASFACSSGQKDISFDKYFDILSVSDVTEVKSQDLTGTCWSYSTTSFIESELLRLGKGKWDLSEMFVVRKIYLDKAEKYLRFQGKANFSQGSLGHDLLRVYQMHGMMPESAYSGYNGQKRHNHTSMEKSMKVYLDSIISAGEIEDGWEKELNRIMDNSMGELPVEFEIDGKTYTARTFADEVLQLNINDYVGFTSFQYQPFNKQIVVEVPDNYSRGKYCNISLSQMVELMKNALSQGHTIEWDGDVSGGGFNPSVGVAVYAPDSVSYKSLNDKPDDHAYNSSVRQKEFDSYKTTDDHLMHITGLAKGKDNVTYFITKNSWGDAISFGGYLMMSEAYIAMRTVCIIVHKDAVPESLKSIVLGSCACNE